MSERRFNDAFMIASRQVGGGAPCLVIAEAGVNHFGYVEKAFALVDLAVEAKADIVKFQHFKTDLLIADRNVEWRDRLRTKELTDAQMLDVRSYCDERGITFLCTGHDEVSLDFLDRVAEVPAFKIGSGEVGNWPFLEQIARRGKPIILSTGMYELEDVRTALDAVARGECRNLAVLHCVTRYPTDPGEVNLSAMSQLRGLFEGPVGYSDHTAGTAVPLAAVALGAEVIEKHITIDRDVPNAQDWKVSCDPSNLVRFVADIREVEAALGGGPKRLAEQEYDSLLWARKSLHAACDILAGTRIESTMIVAQRPGDGMAPHRIVEIIGRRAAAFIPKGAKLEQGWFE